MASSSAECSLDKPPCSLVCGQDSTISNKWCSTAVYHGIKVHICNVHKNVISENTSPARDGGRLHAMPSSLVSNPRSLYPVDTWHCRQPRQQCTKWIQNAWCMMANMSAGSLQRRLYSKLALHLLRGELMSLKTTKLQVLRVWCWVCVGAVLPSVKELRYSVG